MPGDASTPPADAPPVAVARVFNGGPSARRHMQRERRRLALTLLVSLGLHVLLLSLTFGGSATGLPGFSLPWQERRAEVPDLRIVLVPVPPPKLAPPDTGAVASGQGTADTDADRGWRRRV